jgi:hypothetical protein
MNAADYHLIESYITTYIHSITSAKTKMDAMHDLIGQSLGASQAKANLDQSVQFASYNFGITLSNPKDLILAVKSLNDNVIANNGDLNSFLATNAISVTAVFASISASGGYTIVESNIVG